MTTSNAGAPPAKPSAPVVEKSGLGPFDCVHAAIDTAGMVEIVTGATSVGQGMATVLAQICADELGIDYREVPAWCTARPTALPLVWAPLPRE